MADNNELLKMFIESYYQYCVSNVSSCKYLQQPNKSILEFYNEDEDLESFLNQLFINFISVTDYISYDFFKILLNEKEDINLYVLYLLQKNK